MLVSAIAPLPHSVLGQTVRHLSCTRIMQDMSSNQYLRPVQRRFPQQRLSPIERTVYPSILQAAQFTETEATPVQATFDVDALRVALTSPILPSATRLCNDTSYPHLSDCKQLQLSYPRLGDDTGRVTNIGTRTLPPATVPTQEDAYLLCEVTENGPNCTKIDGRPQDVPSFSYQCLGSSSSLVQGRCVYNP